MTENAISSLLDGSHACSINGVLDHAFGGGAVVCVPTGEPGHHMPTLTDWAKAAAPAESAEQRPMWDGLRCKSGSGGAPSGTYKLSRLLLNTGSVINQ